MREDRAEKDDSTMNTETNGKAPGVAEQGVADPRYNGRAAGSRKATPSRRRGHGAVFEPSMLGAIK